MALETEYPGHIDLSASQNVYFGTCEVDNTFGEVKTASVKRTADKEEIANCKGALLAALLRKPRFELSLSVLFTKDKTASAPTLGQTITFPLVNLQGNILDITVEWEDEGARMLSIEATRWDSLGDVSPTSVDEGATP